MASILPLFPKFVFTVLEPISLVAAFTVAMISPEWFIQEQVVISRHLPISDNARAVALQLGMVYLLMAMVEIAILGGTQEAKFVRNYLFACLLGDIGHFVVTYRVLGWERVGNVTQWNSMTFGNIGVTVFLFLTRSAYLLGLFGSHKKSTAKLA
ncbi:uncharacterized protein EAE97_007699 [Botrytis byssoidea]|uniref:DUF7704 domain-containing protein n=1 Tax=Botrytis byssoidea TaxID=139641 RepID=A0A9P5IH75_9HELO|nr:uncharacterized protein EAE97_007699 [Botrytis byssoidea]KAF7937903.1 hypothetical protein EAE97_007699 [Botrytis byssoidea]